MAVATVFVVLASAPGVDRTPLVHVDSATFVADAPVAHGDMTLRGVDTGDRDWTSSPKLEARLAAELLGGAAVGLMVDAALFVPVVLFVVAPCDNRFPASCGHEVNVALLSLAGAGALGSALGVTGIGLSFSHGQHTKRTIGFALLGAGAFAGTELAIVQRSGGLGSSLGPLIGLQVASLAGAAVGYEVAQHLPWSDSIQLAVTPVGVAGQF